MARIDIELVNRGFFDTRSRAQYAIKSGIVLCNGVKVLKNSLLINDSDNITIVGNKMPYVSRGGLKLEKAINLFNINFENKNMIDIGSSTGGFSDCALKHNVKSILAIDVGSLQFSPKLRQNDNIILMENTDFRFIDNKLLNGYTIATIDVSFISAIKLISKISEITDLNEIVLLVKPQFEVGIELAKKYNGVIIDRGAHNYVLKKIIKEFNLINFYVCGLTFSPIKGGSGNIEYLIYFKKNAGLNYKVNIEEIINDAFTTLVNRN